MALFIPKPAVVFSEMHDEAVLFDTDEGRFLQLNACATLMWKTLLRASTLDLAVADLVQQIDADQQTLANAARDFLQQLHAAGLVAEDCSPHDLPTASEDAIDLCMDWAYLGYATRYEYETASSDLDRQDVGHETE